MKNRKKKLSSIFVSLLLLGILTPHSFNPEPVNAQISSILIYAYDADTTDPIAGVGVYLYDDLMNPLDSEITPSSGYVVFSGLDNGTYYVLISGGNYANNDTYITIVDDGDLVFYEFYLEPLKEAILHVTTYDSVYFASISFITVNLYFYQDSSWNLIASDFTSSSGYCSFSNLAAGDYRVDAIDPFRMFVDEESYVTIDYYNQQKNVIFYLDWVYTPGYGSIAVTVLNNQTWSPMANAKIDIYNQDYYWITSFYADINGFFNITGAGPGTYYLEASFDGYGTFGSFVTIDYDGENEILTLFLEPLTPTHSIEILSPSDSSSIEGGLVLINCNATDIANMSYFDIYVNDILITTFNVTSFGFKPEFYVPVFENGTNTIYLEAYWSDMTTANISIDINSYNVIPNVQIKEGDIMDYRYDSLTTSTKIDYNFTFIDWISAFEMNTSVILHQYDHIGTVYSLNYYIVFNILNGYVSVDPTQQLETLHFFPICGLLPDSYVGNKTLMSLWFEILTVNGSRTWYNNGGHTEVWSLKYMEDNPILYVEKDSNVFYHMFIPGEAMLTLVKTSVDFIDPLISKVTDFDYNEGETGNTISWTAMDVNHWSYSIYLDSTMIITSERWVSSSPIIIDVDGLSVGTYTYLIIVSDFAGNTANDTVIVTVNLVVPEYNPVFSFLTIPLIIYISYVIMLKKRKIPRKI